MMSKIAKFGFEIEGEFSQDAITKLQDIGTIKGDGSLNRCNSCCARELYAREFISDPIPALSVRKFDAIIDKLQKLYLAKQYHFNDSCGFHIHCSFSPAMPVEIFSVEFLNFFYKELKEKLPEVYAKRAHNRYCKAETSLNMVAKRGDGERYKGVNLWEAYKKHKTVEFRIFPGDEPLKLKEYLHFTLSTIRKFVKIDLKITSTANIEEQAPVLSRMPETYVNISTAQTHAFPVQYANLTQQVINSPYV